MYRGNDTYREAPMARGLSPLQFALLRVLESGPLTTIEIAERLTMARTTWSQPERNRHCGLRRSLDALYARGLVAAAAQPIDDTREPGYVATGAKVKVWALNTDLGLSQLQASFGGLGVPNRRPAPDVWPTYRP